MATFDPSKYASMGMEDMTTSSMPLLTIIQKSSPQVDETHPDFGTKGIEGAKSGDILFGADNSLHKKLTVLPIRQVELYAEWKPKSAGGGLVAHHPLSIVRSPNYRPRDPNTPKSKEMLGENELVQTTYWMVLFDNGGEWTEGIIAMSSTQLAMSRQWKKLIIGFKYPETSQYKGTTPFIFSRSYILQSEMQRNNQGTWYGWKIVPGDILDKDEHHPLLETAAAACEKATEMLPSAGERKPAAALPPAQGTAQAEADTARVVDAEDCPF
mgnify:CR=1 FL=1